ncbi:hypothetical protein HN709_03435 [Candidatus Peregrinibacteria bacterium]|jgi:hypothetical protein|nr:hypothetical protein [Candidatus Peregrinibacteria bacterium]MBT7736718.1 hypothetical protein [Candidatus Peregrinibacteria bacterium]
MFAENLIIFKRGLTSKRTDVPQVSSETAKEKPREQAKTPSNDEIYETVKKFFEVPDTGEIGNLLFPAYVSNKILDLVTKKIEEGNKFQAIDGIYWQWTDQKGVKKTEIIPTLLEYEHLLSPIAKAEVEKFKKYQQAKKLEAKKLVEKRKSIDLAMQSITTLYEQMLKENEYDNVAELDAEKLESLLEKGYTEIGPMLTGTGKKLVGYVMINPKTEKSENVEMVTIPQEETPAPPAAKKEDPVPSKETTPSEKPTLPEEQAPEDQNLEEEEPMSPEEIEATLNESFELDEEEVQELEQRIQEQEAEQAKIAAERIAIAEQDFPEANSQYQDLEKRVGEIKSDDWTPEAYEEFADQFNEIKEQLASGSTNQEFQALQQFVEAEMLNIESLIAQGATQEEVLEYWKSLNISQQLDQIMQQTTDSSELVRIRMYMSTLEGQFLTLIAANFGLESAMDQKQQ